MSNDFANNNANDLDLDFDLQQLDNTYAQLEPESREVPDAKYEVQIEKIELKPTKQTNKPMVSVQFTILGPQCAGRKLFYNKVIPTGDDATKEKLQWLKNDLATLGYFGLLGQLKSSLSTMLDNVLEVQTSTKNGRQNVYLNKLLGKGAENASAGAVNADDEIPF